MEAWIERAGDVVVVHLRGRVDYGSTEPFRDHCVKHLSKEKVIFNLKELNFVGSIGITDFVSTVTDLANLSPAGIKFASVGSEFRRIFEASEMRNLEVYESTDRALMAFQGAEVEPLPRLSIEDDLSSNDTPSTGEGV